MKKIKPDYTKFIRKPPPLSASPATETDCSVPLPGPIRENDIPWADVVQIILPPSVIQERPLQDAIIIDEDGDRRRRWGGRSQLQELTSKLYSIFPARVRAEHSYPETDAPPLPALALGLIVLLLMLVLPEV